MKRLSLSVFACAVFALFSIAIAVGVVYSVGPPVAITTFPVDSYLVKVIGDNEFTWRYEYLADILVKHNATSNRTIVLDQDVWAEYMDDGDPYTAKLIDAASDESNSVPANQWTEVSTCGALLQDDWEHSSVDVPDCWAGPNDDDTGPILITNPATNCAGIPDWDYESFGLFQVDYLNATEQYPSADDFHVTAKWSYLACLTYDNEVIDETVPAKINVQFRDAVVNVWSGDATIKDLAYQVPADWNMYQAWGETYINPTLNVPSWSKGLWTNSQNQIIGWTAMVRLTFKVKGTDGEWHDYTLPGSGIRVYHLN